MAKISEKIVELAGLLSVDEEKVASGNNSAATRARKTLMEIIKVAKEGRVEIQNERAKKAA